MFPFHSLALGHGQGPPVHLVVGFQRHAVTVMLSHSFLVWLEWQQRQARSLRGPPRGAFSPTARPTLGLVARDASVHH